MNKKSYKVPSYVPKKKPKTQPGAAPDDGIAPATLTSPTVEKAVRQKREPMLHIKPALNAQRRKSKLLELTQRNFYKKLGRQKACQNLEDDFLEVDFMPILPLRKSLCKQIAKQAARTEKYLNAGSLFKLINASDLSSGDPFSILERPEFNPEEQCKLENASIILNEVRNMNPEIPFVSAKAKTVTPPPVQPVIKKPMQLKMSKNECIWLVVKGHGRKLTQPSPTTTAQEQHKVTISSASKRANAPVPHQKCKPFSKEAQTLKPAGRGRGRGIKPGSEPSNNAGAPRVDQQPAQMIQQATGQAKVPKTLSVQSQQVQPQQQTTVLGKRKLAASKLAPKVVASKPPMETMRPKSKPKASEEQAADISQSESPSKPKEEPQILKESQLSGKQSQPKQSTMASWANKEGSKNFKKCFTIEKITDVHKQHQRLQQTTMQAPLAFQEEQAPPPKPPVIEEQQQPVVMSPVKPPQQPTFASKLPSLKTVLRTRNEQTPENTQQSQPQQNQQSTWQLQQQQQKPSLQQQEATTNLYGDYGYEQIPLTPSSNLLKPHQAQRCVSQRRYEPADQIMVVESVGNHYQKETQAGYQIRSDVQEKEIKTPASSNQKAGPMVRQTSFVSQPHPPEQQVEVNIGSAPINNQSGQNDYASRNYNYLANEKSWPKTVYHQQQNQHPSNQENVYAAQQSNSLKSGLPRQCCSGLDKCIHQQPAMSQALNFSERVENNLPLPINILPSHQDQVPKLPSLKQRIQQQSQQQGRQEKNAEMRAMQTKTSFGVVPKLPQSEQESTRQSLQYQQRNLQQYQNRATSAQQAQTQQLPSLSKKLRQQANAEQQLKYNGSSNSKLLNGPAERTLPPIQQLQNGAVSRQQPTAEVASSIGIGGNTQQNLPQMPPIYQLVYQNQQCSSMTTATSISMPASRQQQNFTLPQPSQLTTIPLAQMQAPVVAKQLQTQQQPTYIYYQQVPQSAPPPPPQSQQSGEQAINGHAMGYNSRAAAHNQTSSYPMGQAQQISFSNRQGYNPSDNRGQNGMHQQARPTTSAVQDSWAAPYKMGGAQRSLGGPPQQVQQLDQLNYQAAQQQAQQPQHAQGRANQQQRERHHPNDVFY